MCRVLEHLRRAAHRPGAPAARRGTPCRRALCRARGAGPLGAQPADRAGAGGAPAGGRGGGLRAGGAAPRRAQGAAMIDLSLLPDGGLGWLDGSGPGSDLVLSTRVRLARNLAGRVFGSRNTAEEREGVLADVRAAARGTVSLGAAFEFPVDRLDPVDRQLLHERHLI